MEYPKLENLNSSNCTERSIEKHYPDFWKYIIENYHHSMNWTERLYWFYHNLTDFPKCPVCGERTKFINIKTGYREFCSTKCMNSSKIIQDRKKETSIKNWGVDNPMRNKYIQEKHAQTNLKKYGVKNPFSSESVKEKIKQTNLKKYGYEHHLQNKEILNKQINTNLKKYGVPHISKLNEYKKKIRKICLERYGGVGYESDIINAKIENTNIKKYGVKNISLNEANKLLVSEKLRMRSMKNHNRLIGYTDDNKWIMSCPHENCDKCLQKQYITYAGREYDRNKANLEPCTILNPINSNMSSLEEFIKNILSDNNIDYKNNITGLIDGRKELDIYIPSKNIAIECNGIYWHSSINKLSSYHIQKYKSCHLQNIQLLSIWEDWVKTKPQIIESIILNKLGLCNNTIYARKTQIREVDSKLCEK